MTQEMKRSNGVGWGIIITVFIVLLILTAIPVAQYYAVYCFSGIEGLKAYLPLGNPSFYQFILSCFAVLAAIAGYLTYKSREEAREEIEHIKTEMEKKKMEVDDYCTRIKKELEEIIKEEIEHIKTEMEKKKLEVDDYCTIIKKALESVLNETQTQSKGAIIAVEEKAATVQKSISLAETHIKHIAEEKAASIVGIQLPALGETNNERDAREFLNKGITAYTNGKIEEAIDLFSKALGKNPNFAGAYNNRGVSLDEKGDYDGAIKDYNKAILIDPNYSDAYNNRGNSRAKKGDYDGAIVDCTEAIRINPKNANAYHNRGLTRNYKKDYDGAIADFTESIRLNPTPDTYSNRSVARIGKGDYDGAIADCTEAIRLNPNHANAYYNCSCGWAQKKDVQHCAADLNKAVSLDKTYLVKAQNDNDFDPVRKEPEIVAILSSGEK
jgi:tetratricopeptide (TPR) repeat protein